MKSQKAYPKVTGRSDRLIVPKKAVNKVEKSMAELVEGRGLTKGNTYTTSDAQTQSWKSITLRLMSVREAAKKDKEVKFTALFHHIGVPLLRESFYSLKRDTATGIDDVSWYQYEQEITTNLEKLYIAIRTGAYRPKPARRIAIPKADGTERPISIQSIEDKIVQQAVVAILEQIYEVDFVGFSYGFRPGRNQHDALDALHVGLMSKKVNWVLDLDIKKFFDNVNHDWLIKFLQHKVKDKRIIRLITQWLKVGYVNDRGRKIRSNMGTPQGSVISPLLSNIYLHYIFDLWSHQWRKRNSRGDMVIIRYADDSVLAFQHHNDAQCFLRDLKTRMSRFGLELHEGKTRLIEFGRFAIQRRKEKGLGKPETFDFLGFTHYCGKTRKAGKFMIGRKTIKKRLIKRLKELRKELLKRRHNPIKKTAKWLASVIQGHMNYFGVPGNSKSVNLFSFELQRAWYWSLCRRSQRKRLNWVKFDQYLKPLLPKIRVLHPYPNERFYAKYPR